MPLNTVQLDRRPVSLEKSRCWQARQLYTKICNKLATQPVLNHIRENVRNNKLTFVWQSWWSSNTVLATSLAIVQFYQGTYCSTQIMLSTCWRLCSVLAYLNCGDYITTDFNHDLNQVIFCQIITNLNYSRMYTLNRFYARNIQHKHNTCTVWNFSKLPTRDQIQAQANML